MKSLYQSQFSHNTQSTTTKSTSNAIFKTFNKLEDSVAAPKNRFVSIARTRRPASQGRPFLASPDLPSHLSVYIQESEPDMNRMAPHTSDEGDEDYEYQSNISRYEEITHSASAKL